MTDILSRQIDFLGNEAFLIVNEHLELIVVPALGSRVVSLRSKLAQTDILRVPPSIEAYEKNPMLYGIPILFPPNRIEDGVFTFGDQTYRFVINEPQHHNHLHGMVQGEAWKLTGIQVKDDQICLETEFDSRDKPNVLEQFTHPFRIVMRFILDGGSFVQEAEVYNESDTTFPWGIGYHTTFRFPFGEHSDLGDCLFSAPVGKCWELNDRVLPTGSLLEDPRSSVLQQGMSLEGILLDDVFIAAEASENMAVLTDQGAGLRVTYKADEQFRQWVLHTGEENSGYLCPEPYTCVTNAFNLPLDRKLSGLQVLEPGQCTTVRCAINVESLVL